MTRTREMLALMFACVMYVSVFEECYKTESLLKLYSAHEHVGDGSRDVTKKLYVLLNSLESLVYGLPVKSLVWQYSARHPISVQFSHSDPTLCNPMDCSMPGFPVHHQLPNLTQTQVHRIADAIQPSHPLSSPSPTFTLSQHQGLFQGVSSSY